MVAFLDTLQTAKRLREAGFAEPQAEALTDLLRDAREAGQVQLATKSDLGALEVKIDGVAAELNATGLRPCSMPRSTELCLTSGRNLP